jgi:Ras-related protein Rab-6A
MATAPPKFKLTFIGDQSVGKTSLITRFCSSSFDANYQATIGVDLMSKLISVQSSKSNQPVNIRLHLWDSAGQERFWSLIPSYVRDSSAVIVVFDLSNPRSLANVSMWVEWVKKEAQPDVLMYLVGNKKDIADDSVKNSVKSDGFIRYYEVSAKSGDSVDSLFKEVGKDLLAKIEGVNSKNNTNNSNIQLTPTSTATTTGCANNC